MIGSENLTDTRPPRVLITLCTYNERENIARLIPEIRQIVPEADLLVIDDHSPDGTGELAETMAAEDPQVHVLHRTGKQGLGTAMIAGFQYAIERHYDFLVNLDADCSHPPRFLPALLAKAPTTDLVIGSRYVDGGGIQGWSLWRHIMSRAINLYTRLLLGLSTRDNSGSYRCYRVDRLAELPVSAIRARGYAILEEILFRCQRAGWSIDEVPIQFEERRYGQSKINWKEAVSTLWTILRLRCCP